MTLRLAKISLVLSVALYYAFIVFNNLTDYDSNYQFVRHVLMMDTTFPGNHGMWRALNQPAIHTAAYISLIAWEFVAMLLCAAGAYQLARAVRQDAPTFNSAKRIAILGLAVGMLQWFFAFIAVGGEWFLMWQSHTWNGEETAFRVFAILGLIFLLLIQPDTADQP
jgi:predicted small integral membrane protein